MYRRRHKRRRIVQWDAPPEAREAVAQRASYAGSHEHKTAPSPTGPPHPRSDASKCPNQLHLRLDDGTLVWQPRILEALRNALRAGLIDGSFEGDFPRYVWGVFEGGLYEARHLGAPLGAYKAYPTEPVELDDPQHLLPS